jgi:hypothetical protein
MEEQALMAAKAAAAGKRDMPHDLYGGKESYTDILSDYNNGKIDKLPQYMGTLEEKPYDHYKIVAQTLSPNKSQYEAPELSARRTIESRYPRLSKTSKTYQDLYNQNLEAFTQYPAPYKQRDLEEAKFNLEQQKFSHQVNQDAKKDSDKNKGLLFSGQPTTIDYISKSGQQQSDPYTEYSFTESKPITIATNFSWTPQVREKINGVWGDSKNGGGERKGQHSVSGAIMGVVERQVPKTGAGQLGFELTPTTERYLKIVKPESQGGQVTFVPLKDASSALQKAYKMTAKQVEDLISNDLGEVNNTIQQVDPTIVKEQVVAQQPIQSNIPQKSNNIPQGGNKR